MIFLCVLQPEYVERHMRHSDNKENSWTWRQAWRRALEVLQQDGPQSLWFKVLSETVYRRVILLERLLDEPEAKSHPVCRWMWVC